MMHIARQMPAWILACLPARLARHCASAFSPSAHASSPSQTNLQLLVDVSVIHRNDARTGVQRVVRALLLQLIHNPPIGYRVCPVFATRKHGYCYAASDFLENPAQALNAVNRPVQAQNGDIFLGLDLSAHLLPHHQAQVLQWKRIGVKLHVLVYDLLPLQHPEWFNPKTTRNFRRWIRWVAVYTDSAICISKTVEIDLHTWLRYKLGLPISALSTSTITLGADIDASVPSGGLPLDAEALLSRLHQTPSVLMVGTLEPRKGYDQAVAAFEQLWQKSGPAPLLIIVGRAGWKTDVLQEKLRNHPEACQRFFWLDDVSDEYLSHLYTACSGVLVASRGEGYGLPLIEAIRHGKPVLARDLAVFREFQVEGITYFQGETPSILARSVTDWLATCPLPTHFPSLDRPAPLFPTWRLSATQLLQNLGLQQSCSELDVVFPESEEIIKNTTISHLLGRTA